VLLSLVVARAAIAQELDPSGEDVKRQRARDVAVEAERLYDQSRYQQALDKLSDAYLIYPSPKLYFNFGKVQRALERDVDALEAFERFLAETPESEFDLAERREEAARQVSALKERIGYLQVATDVVGAEVVVAGKTRGKTPVVLPLRVPAGLQEVTLRKDGRSLYSDRVEIDPGGRLRLAVRLGVVAAPSLPAAALMPAPQAGPPVYRRWWFWTAGAAVLAVAATTVAVVSQSEGKNVCSRCDVVFPITP
jgi:hypothetical protein